MALKDIQTVASNGDLLSIGGSTRWQSYIPTLKGSVSDPTVSSTSAFWRRNGSNIEVTSRFTLTAAGSGNYSISIPTGLSINYSSGAIDGTDFVIGNGSGYFITNTGGTRIGLVAGALNSGSFVNRVLAYKYNSGSLANGDFVTNGTIWISFVMPITGW
jgi:hypothetical protein